MFNKYMIILYELTQALFLQTPLAIELDVFFLYFVHCHCDNRTRQLSQW